MSRERTDIQDTPLDKMLRVVEGNVAQLSEIAPGVVHQEQEPPQECAIQLAALALADIAQTLDAIHDRVAEIEMHLRER